jgi:hypothetical protein
VSKPIQMRLGGYGPPHTSFSKGLKRIEAEFSDEVTVHYVWNIMDLGYRGSLSRKPPFRLRPASVVMPVPAQYPPWVSSRHCYAAACQTDLLLNRVAGAS